MRKILFVVVLTALPFLTGCFGVNNYFRAVRNDIISHVNEDFYEDMEFSIGPVGLSVVRLLAPEEGDPEASQILENIRRVQVGIYKRNIRNKDQSYSGVIKSIDRRMKKHGWQYIVKTRSKDEWSVIYVNSDQHKFLRRIFVVNMDKEELVIVQVDGNLQKVIQTAVRERGLDDIRF